MNWTQVFSFPLFLCIIFLFPQITLYWELIAGSLVVLGIITIFIIDYFEKGNNV
jgi:hypothetical protein